MLEAVAVDAVAEDEDGAVGEEGEGVDVPRFKEGDPVGCGVALLGEGDPSRGFWMRCVVVLRDSRIRRGARRDVGRSVRGSLALQRGRTGLWGGERAEVCAAQEWGQPGARESKGDMGAYGGKSCRR